MLSPRSSTALLQRSLASSLSISRTRHGACGVSIITAPASHPKVCLRYRRHWYQVTKRQALLTLYIDVELALGSALVVQQSLSNTASNDVVPAQDINNLQPSTDEVTAPTAFQVLGPSNGSTTDLEHVDIPNESQAAASPGIDPDAAFGLPLQPLQSPGLDVVPVQGNTSTQAVAHPEDPSVSRPALNFPGVPASSSTPVHSSDGS